jgi:beta-glucanase (GH16 family)
VHTFASGFNGTSVNTARWAKTWWDNPGNGNGISWSNNPYMTACYAASHDSESGGYLRMRLDRTPNTCGTRRSYTGAVLDTHASFSQEGGAFEARVFLPCNAQGQVYGWPAWWTVDNTWTGEIDNVEGGSIAAGRAGGTAANLHYASQPPTGWVSGSPLCRWHDFGTKWNAATRTVTFYWDSRRVYSQPFPVGAGHPEYLVFDYQMFANGIPPPSRGATMLVDWVRAWRVG